ncbi:hypothetical protein [Bradyrhizobium sp. CCBAU 11357]|uniref:hypothetical protein n=1 Tax=Bradyrhizobium sp. CCBAU 11357 TaxID=1630808 RepID=UPI002302593D|nr:hypothetical protein [Bradyrhizobium sp. CCBAU 11357]
MSLGDLDELVLRCRTEEGRKYIVEAVTCYKAGAYRACIVATWVAVVYDLISKIREIALSGDPAAQQIVADLNRFQPLIAQNDLGAIKKSLDLERGIVDICNTQFGFFEGMEVLDLTRLHDDRNRCAHPSYQGMETPYSPSGELARAHLVHAIQHVLSQAPVQGRAATAQVLRLVTSQYFPLDIDNAKLQLKSIGLDRVRESVIRATIDQLTYGYIEGGPDLKGLRRTLSAICALSEMHSDICGPRIKGALNKMGRRVSDPDLLYFFGLLMHYGRTWEMLEDDNRNRVKEMVRLSNDNIAEHAIPIALKERDLEEVSRERLWRLPLSGLRNIAQQTKHPIVIDACVNLYCSSRNWEIANSNYQSLEPVLDDLTQDQVRRILKARVAEQADLPGAHSFGAFCLHIYKTEKISRAELLETLNTHGGEYVARDLTRGTNDDIPF